MSGYPSRIWSGDQYDPHPADVLGPDPDRGKVRGGHYGPAF